MAVGGMVLALALLQALQQQPLDRSGVFAPGPRIPVRFARSITGGRDRVGALIEAQAMAPLKAGGCVLVPAFTPILGTIVASRPGRLFGRRGYLQMRFDSVLASPEQWVALDGVLDSLEWAPRGPWSAEGGVEQKPRSIRGIVGTAGLADWRARPWASASFPSWR